MNLPERNTESHVRERLDDIDRSQECVGHNVGNGNNVGNGTRTSDKDETNDSRTHVPRKGKGGLIVRHMPRNEKVSMVNVGGELTILN